MEDSKPKTPDYRSMSTESLAPLFAAKMEYLNEKPRRKKNLISEQLIEVQTFMVKKMTKEPNSSELDKYFVQNLDLLTEINERKFKNVTKLLCELCVSVDIRYDFLDNLMITWRNYASGFSEAVKSSVFTDCFKHFQKVAKFVPTVGRFSVQVRILEVLFCYMNCKSDGSYGNMQKLFDGVIDKTAWIWEEFKLLDDLNEQQKYNLLFRSLPNFLNKTGQQISSKIIRYLFFDGDAVTPYPSHRAWVDWNRGFKTVEFSLTTHGKTANVRIDDDNLKFLYFEVSAETKRVREIKFILNNPLRLNCESDVDVLNIRTINEIQMQLHNEFELDEFKELLAQMFPRKYHFDGAQINDDKIKPLTDQYQPHGLSVLGSASEELVKVWNNYCGSDEIKRSTPMSFYKPNLKDGIEMGQPVVAPDAGPKLNGDDNSFVQVRVTQTNTIELIVPKSEFVKPLPPTGKRVREKKSQPRLNSTTGNSTTTECKNPTTRRMLNFDSDSSKGSLTPAKRSRRLSSIFIDKYERNELAKANNDSYNTHTLNGNHDDDEATMIPESTTSNREDQFNSLLNGPLCFMGKIQSNAKELYQNDSAKLKSKRGNASDSDSD